MAPILRKQVDVPVFSNDPAAAPHDNANVPPPHAGTAQSPVVCPYCRRPLATRADGSFSCVRCGEFPNYSRMYSAPPR